MAEDIEFGTCSWNYDSWIGLLYSKKASYSAAYLKEYSSKYSTVEVDSWCFKLPTPEDALEYKSQTHTGFTFSRMNEPEIRLRNSYRIP